MPTYTYKNQDSGQILTKIWPIAKMLEEEGHRCGVARWGWVGWGRVRAKPLVQITVSGTVTTVCCAVHSERREVTTLT